MELRLNGINTPFGGISWEYTKDGKKQHCPTIAPNQKIKVFISSKCGEEKYDKVRAELKTAIESTQLAEVYTFESKGASTLPAGAHYTLALEDSDICIFLIDNADGISQGVQKEIDTVKKLKIQALYYFCNENCKEKTALEQSLMGERYAKSKTVSSFSELSRDSAQALIDDIVNIYHYYCAGKIALRTDEPEDTQGVAITGVEKYNLPTIPRTVLKNVDKCKDYLQKFVFGYTMASPPENAERTSELDDWCIQFLHILLEGKSIKDFNTGMYLEELEKQQEKSYYRVVQIRWQAIQAYFSGEIEKCLECLDAALKLAKQTRQPTWVINDILIDIRNQHWTYCTANNQYSDTNAQKELNESDEAIYYPILDRIHESLGEKCIAGLYEEKTRSPYTITFGSSDDQCCEMIAGSLVVSMYNGSLTHILLFYEKMQHFVFYLNCKYDSWYLRLNLYKLAILAGKKDEIIGIQNAYPEVLNNLNATEAEAIMRFCLNLPIEYRRFNSQLLAFGSVGYFLEDNCFHYYEKSIVQQIKGWVSSDHSVVASGYGIFESLESVSRRISQDVLSEICCLFIDRHYSRWYTEMFKFIAKAINLRKMSDESAKKLISHIVSMFDSENDREQIGYSPRFLSVLRRQDCFLTDELDNLVLKYFPDYYEDAYRLETTQNMEEDMPLFIQRYTERIRKSNESQGKGGCYFAHITRDFTTIRAILLRGEFACGSDIMDELISVTADTLLLSKEPVYIKLDAVALLICIVLKYPGDYMRNHRIFEGIFEGYESIGNSDCSGLESNIDSISLRIALSILFLSMGKEVYADILEQFPFIQGDIPTTIAVSNLIVQYLESSTSVIMPVKVEAIILQNVLQWLHSNHLDIRMNATHILFALTRNAENCGIVNHQLVILVDSESAYIKNLILRNLHEINGITERTKEYILSKCRNDANFVVRSVCSQITERLV